MTNTNKKKNSSIELLRIVAMFFIVLGHYTTHGGFSNVIDEMNFNSTYLSCIALFGGISCYIFSLITGFYMVDNNSNFLMQYKRFFKLLSQLLFYSLCALLFLMLLKAFNFLQNDSNLALNSTSIVHCFFPIFFGNWYFKTYLYFMLFIPFINKTINSIQRIEHMVLAYVAFITWCIINNLAIMDSLYGSLGMMFTMYLIGSYIKKYKNRFKINNTLYLSIALFSSLLKIVIQILYHISSVNAFLVAMENVFGSFNVMDCIDSLLSCIIAIYLFLFFSNFDFQNKKIDAIASSTSGIYLLHDNDYFRYLIWIVISPNLVYYSNPVIHSIVKTILVFVICSIIDLIRQKVIGNRINSFINVKYDELVSKINNNH